jgi:acetyl-CoA carboxylase, biotin carboxylase subunit
VDDGFEQGMTVPIYYDPLIAKLVAYGKDREEAITRMIRAIDEYQILGIENTLSFGKFVMEHPAFRSGKFDTHFVADYFSPEKLQPKPDASNTKIATALAGMLFTGKKKVFNTQSKGNQRNKWKNRLK